LIIVFGAGGFIGTYLVDRLATDGLDVVASDIVDSAKDHYKKNGIRFTKLDITSPPEFDKLPVEGVESVVDLACLQPANVSKMKYSPLEYMNVNVIGTLNVLEYCRKAGIKKVIYASSHRQMEGLWNQGVPLREDAGRSLKYTGEFAMYSISQAAAEDCVMHYSRQYGMQGIIFRLPPVYGYGPHTEIFKHGEPIKTGFQIFMENAESGKPVELWGNVEKGRDIIYVKDVVLAFVLALKNKEASGVYNIASGRYLTLRQEAEEIVRAFSPSSQPSQIVLRPEKPNSVESFVYDISKARQDLGWAPQYTFAQMLQDYKKEKQSGRFKFLVEKRRHMFHEL